MNATPDDPDLPLTFPQLVKLRRMIRKAAQRARLGEADELEVLRLISIGDREGAQRYANEALVRSMQRALDALLTAAGA